MQFMTQWSLWEDICEVDHTLRHFVGDIICVPAQDNHGFVANAIIELQPKISENPTTGQ